MGEFCLTDWVKKRTNNVELIRLQICLGILKFVFKIMQKSGPWFGIFDLRQMSVSCRFNFFGDAVDTVHTLTTTPYPIDNTSLFTP